MRKRIGILIGNIHTVFPTKLLENFDEWAKKEDMDIVFFLGTESTGFTAENGERDDDYDYQYATIYDYTLFAKLDGLIIAYGLVTAMQEISDKETFLKKFDGMKTVILQEPVEYKDSAYLITDNFSGIYHCVEHLIKEHGCKNILYLSGPMSNHDAVERRRAYLAAMKDANLPVTDSMIAYGDYSEFVESKVEELLDNNENIDAIACANDEMAQCLYRVCEKRGIRVGRDIKVTGFDDIPRAKVMDPPLTTVRQMADYMAVTSMKMISDMIDGEEVSSRKVPVEMIKRGSCGCEYEMFDRRKASSPERQGESISRMMDKVTRSWQRALSGPFLIRKLINVSDNTEKFMKGVVEQMRANGAKRSYLYLLAHPTVVNEDTVWKTPDRIYLAAMQDGDEIIFYPRNRRIRVCHGEGIIKNDHEGNFYTFLLMDGERQYGILSVQIDVDEVSYFHMLALQVGTALHFHEVVQAEARAREQLEEQNALLNFSATVDELTGCFNRRGILERVMQINHDEKDKTAIVVMADMDHLKEINDTFGHSEGDSAIRTTANILRTVMGSNGALGRLGGDEFFGILLLDPDEDVEKRKERLDSEIVDGCVAYNVVSGKPYFLGISHGIIHMKVSDGIDFTNILERSDELLYEAKKNRRKTVIRDVSVADHDFDDVLNDLFTDADEGQGI